MSCGSKLSRQKAVKRNVVSRGWSDESDQFLKVCLHPRIARLPVTSDHLEQSPPSSLSFTLSIFILFYFFVDVFDLWESVTGSVDGSP